MTEQLLLPSFSIRGYRGFEALDIERLGRVNLLVGRNAVGKTSVLEAIELWANDLGTVSPHLVQILSGRHELQFISRMSRAARGVDWLRAFHAATDWENARIRIGAIGRPDEALSIIQRRGLWQPREGGRREFVLTSKDADVPAMSAIQFLRSSHTVFHPLDQSYLLERLEDRPPYERVPGSGLSPGSVPPAWDHAILRDRDHHVLEAMRLIVPDLQRLTFVERPRSSVEPAEAEPSNRIPVITRKGRKSEPLRAFGDGAVRVLELILSLVNVESGVLLVDEIENGVHYSVLPDLWRLVFVVAAELDVQVVAATHSWDCIEAFQKAATAHPADGMLIRLERDDHGTRAALFTEDDLETVTTAGIEVR